MVNREVLYLRERARSYARAYGLEAQWSAEYGDISVAKKMQSSRKKSRHVVRHQQRVLSVDYDSALILREHALDFPIDRRFFRISAPFGPRRTRDGSLEFHYGLDMAAPYKTPVKSSGKGVVIESGRGTGRASGFGNTVVVAHSNKLKTRYAHLARCVVKVGDAVDKGEVIGLVGNTGRVRGKNGIHLHFEVLLYGKRIDPWYVFSDLRLG